MFAVKKEGVWKLISCAVMVEIGHTVREIAQNHQRLALDVFVYEDQIVFWEKGDLQGWIKRDTFFENYNPDKNYTLVLRAGDIINLDKTFCTATKEHLSKLSISPEDICNFNNEKYLEIIKHPNGIAVTPFNNILSDNWKEIVLDNMGRFVYKIKENIDTLENEENDYIRVGRNSGEKDWFILSEKQIKEDDSDYAKNIHRKDEEILIAFMRDENVVIECCIDKKTNVWATPPCFVTSYSKDVEYRLKESFIEKEKDYIIAPEGVTKYNIPDFECELLKETENTVIGMIYQNESWFGCAWDKNGFCHQKNGFGYKEMDLVPYQEPKNWFEDESNFPCVIADCENNLSIAYRYEKENHELWDCYDDNIVSAKFARLATKEEKEKLFNIKIME